MPPIKEKMIQNRFGTFSVEQARVHLNFQTISRRKGATDDCNAKNLRLINLLVRAAGRGPSEDLNDGTFNVDIGHASKVQKRTAIFQKIAILASTFIRCLTKRSSLY